MISDSFWRTAVTGTKNLSRAGLKEGIDAVLIGLAAEESRRSGQAVDMSSLRTEVYTPAGDQARQDETLLTGRGASDGEH